MIVNVSWAPSSAPGLTGYDVKFVKNGIDILASVAAGATSQSIVATYGDSISVAVRAKNAAGAGEWSDPVPAVVVPPLPVPDKVTGVTLILN
jgi:hypothetical protein